MSRTKTITLYTFDELPTPAAKEKARDWYRSTAGPEDLQFVIEDAETVLGLLGVRDPNIWWQVGYVQSDGACFEGTYTYAKGAHRKIRQHAPEDTELHRIADGLLAIQRRYRYQVSVNVRNDHRGFWPVLDDVEPCAITPEDFKALQELMRALCQWIYNQLREEDEYRSADEQVDEMIRENGYEFTAAGERED